MLSTLFVTQMVWLKKDHTKNVSHSRHKNCITFGLSKKDHAQDFLLWLRFLCISHLRVGFSDSLLKKRILKLNSALGVFTQPQSFK